MSEAIKWNDSLSLGLEVIDEQHKKLLKIVNEVIGCFDRDDRDHFLKIKFSELREYTVIHFHDEEDYMVKIQYDKITEHKKQHDDLKKQVKSYQASFFHHESITKDQLIEFFRNWLLEHILNHDMSIKTFLVQKEEDDIPADEKEKNSDDETKDDSPK